MKTSTENTSLREVYKTIAMLSNYRLEAVGENTVFLYDPYKSRSGEKRLKLMW